MQGNDRGDKETIRIEEINKEMLNTKRRREERDGKIKW